METLTEIGALFLIGNALWFIQAYRRNKRRARQNAQMRESLDRLMKSKGGQE